MTDAVAFPRLTHLMGTYLNQDWDDLYANEAEAILDFARTSWAGDLRETIAEIDAMLAGPVDGLLERYARQTGPWDLRIGETDAEARAWLLDARALMAGVLERGEVQAAAPPRPPIVRWLARLGGINAPPRLFSRP